MRSYLRNVSALPSLVLAVDHSSWMNMSQGHGLEAPSVLTSSRTNFPAERYREDLMSYFHNSVTYILKCGLWSRSGVCNVLVSCHEASRRLMVSEVSVPLSSLACGDERDRQSGLLDQRDTSIFLLKLVESVYERFESIPLFSPLLASWPFWIFMICQSRVNPEFKHGICI